MRGVKAFINKIDDITKFSSRVRPISGSSNSNNDSDESKEYVECVGDDQSIFVISVSVNIFPSSDQSRGIAPILF